MELQLRVQPSKTQTSASRGMQERCGTSLIGKLVLEVPRSDSKRSKDRFYSEHHEHKILLPGIDLPWTKPL